MRRKSGKREQSVQGGACNSLRLSKFPSNETLQFISHDLQKFRNKTNSKQLQQLRSNKESTIGFCSDEKKRDEHWLGRYLTKLPEKNAKPAATSQ
jgi:hypothetical protein